MPRLLLPGTLQLWDEATANGNSEGDKVSHWSVRVSYLDGRPVAVVLRDADHAGHEVTAHINESARELLIRAD